MGFGAGVSCWIQGFYRLEKVDFRGVDKLCFNSCVRVDVKCMNIQKVWNQENA